MTYLDFRRLRFLVGLLLAGLGWAGLPQARAQSGPYGNEWIVPGQSYYKVKVWRDGLYRLDYAYLNQLAGAGAVPPTQLQLWRRGREVAVFQGGNGAALDNTTYLEFYGERNDAALDKEYYKNPKLQFNPHYSFFTDTAAYFVTWGTRAGKRMAQPAAAGGAPHAWRLQASLTQKTDFYTQSPYLRFTYQPWLESGEGFFSYFLNQDVLAKFPLDTLLRAVVTSPGAPPPRLDVVLSGTTRVKHIIDVSVVPPGGASRVLGTFRSELFDYMSGRFVLQPTDIGPNGSVELGLLRVPYPKVNPTDPSDAFRLSWWRVTAAQQNVWFADRRQVGFLNDSLLAGPATYEVDNLPATVRGYDVHDPWNVQRIEPAPAQTLGATARRFVFPSATEQQSRRLLLADAARPRVPPPARRVVFRAIDPVRPTFVIITHPQLMGPAAGVPNAARAYANYRASVAGGRYDTLMVTAGQLYDQFHYGERSLIGLRHFARWLAANVPTGQTKYLLLLGKGISPGTEVAVGSPSDFNPGFGTSAFNSTRIQGEKGLDLVPISSRSPSDNFLSNDFMNDRYEAALPTGRLVATTPQEVMNYLSKLREHEAQLDPNQLDPAPWHKRVVQLVGGETAADLITFNEYMDSYKRTLQGPLLGARVTSYRKTDPKTRLSLNIAPDLNAGLSMISYFGHGSTTEFDINLGDINDPTTGYANAGKYPVMCYNGCFAGAVFFNTTTYSNSWILAPNKGAVGFMAESGLSFDAPLNYAQTVSDKVFFTEPQWFGRPVAEMHREVVRRLQIDPAFAASAPYPEATIEQLQCTLWQGDPALRLFAPAKPDLVASNATLALAPIAPDPVVSAASTNFTLRIGVRNPGRVTRDSVEVRVTRTFPASSGLAPEVISFNNQRDANNVLHKPFPAFFGADTTYSVTLSNPAGKPFFGDNTFKVELDYRNKIAELDENNNVATLTYSFLRRGITLLTPTEFAIVPTTTPRLVAQSNDPAGQPRGYDFQVDSVATFDSPALQQSLNQQAAVVTSYTPRPLLPGTRRDSAVWYWRVRFTSPVGAEDASWQLSSFRVLPAAVRGGWSQSHYAQFGRDQLQQLSQSAPGGRWSFAGTPLPVVLRTVGGGPPGSAPNFVAGGGSIRTDLNAPPYLNDCGTGAPNLLVAVLDPRTLQRVAVPGTYATCGNSDQTFYHFGASPVWAGDTLDNLHNSATRRAQLLDFLMKIPEGSLVLLVSQNRLRWAAPVLAPARQQLAAALGSQLVSGLRNGEGWAIVARKGVAGGQLLAEAGPDRAQPNPAGQAILLDFNRPTAGTAGSITSTLIGPARQWQTLYHTIKRETPTGTYTLSLSGIDAAGKATVLNASVGSQPLDLSGYSATAYPYMQLSLALADPTSRVPPQLKQWLVTYQGLPEGVVRRDLVAAAVYDSVRLRNQALAGQLRFPVKFENVAPEAFASRLKVQARLINAATGLPVPNSTKLIDAVRDVAASDSALTTMVTLDMIGKFGRFYPEVIVNPQLQPEQFYFNNVLRLDAFTVRDSNLPPTLDVAVDGRHILDGELVAPRPLVSIQLKSTDRLRLIKDASYFTVFLQKDGQAPLPVDVNGPLVRFSVDNTNGSNARLDYQPGLSAPLPDGLYTLRVQGRDATNQKAGSQDFQVKFQVVNASTITNVFPYPNPVTSKARFVFTLTGQELPRNMKIQILTLTGRVVREIFMAELGPLHIGNNLTDFAWDGTDQYGDRLANGTYLYRVSLDDPKGDFQRRTTAGDQAFKNDWGKLVLLR